MLTCDWETAKSPPLLERLGFRDGGGRRNDNGIEDEAVLESLDLAHHLGLVIRRAVVVDHTKPTEKRNVNSHVVFGDGVHGRGDKWRLEGDALRDRGVEGDIDGREAYIALLERLRDYILDFHNVPTATARSHKTCSACSSCEARGRTRLLHGSRESLHAGLRTNVAGKHEEVIVRQTAVLLRVNERLDIDTIALWVLVLEHLKRLGVVQGVGGGVGHGVSVGNRHDERKYVFSGNREERVRLDLTKQTAVVEQLWPGKCPVSQEEKKQKKFRAAEFVGARRERSVRPCDPASSVFLPRLAL